MCTIRTTTMTTPLPRSPYLNPHPRPPTHPKRTTPAERRNQPATHPPTRPITHLNTQLAYNYGSFICAGLFAGICFLAASVALYFHVQVCILMCTYTYVYI